MAKRNLKICSFQEINEKRCTYYRECADLLRKSSLTPEVSKLLNPMFQTLLIDKLINLFVEICFFFDVSPSEWQTREISEEDRAELAKLVTEDSRIALRVPCDEGLLEGSQSMMIICYNAAKITPEEFVRFAKYKRYMSILAGEEIRT